MGRASLILAIFLRGLGTGDDDVSIPESASPRVYTEPHKVLYGNDWYWLRFPLSYSSRVPTPAVILLHGREEVESDQGRQFVTGSWAAQFHDRGWIVAAPTMMKRHRPTWVDADNFLLGLAQRLRRTYSVSGLYLAGFSAGARAAMEYGLRHPWEFDGILALGGGAGGRPDPGGASLPLFVGIGTRDDKCYDSMKSRAADLRTQGFAGLSWREYEGVAHELSDRMVADSAAWATEQLGGLRARRDHRAERLRRLQAGCATGDAWLQLAEWCRTHRFEPEAAFALRKALEINPQKEQARAAAGFIRVGERWISREALEREPVLPDGRVVRKLPPSEKSQAVRAAERDLLSPDREVRAAAALSLGLLAQETSLPALVLTLRTETEPALIPVLQDALVRLRPRAVGSALQKWAGDPALPLEVKGTALEVLERLPAEAGLPAILHFYLADPAARGAARGVLANAGEAALARLAPLLADRDARIAALAAEAAGEIRSRRTAPMLVKLLGHSDPAVQSAARIALVKTGRPAVPDLLAALEGSERERAAEILRSVTGQTFGAEEKARWAEWARRNRQDP